MIETCDRGSKARAQSPPCVAQWRRVGPAPIGREQRSGFSSDRRRWRHIKERDKVLFAPTAASGNQTPSHVTGEVDFEYLDVGTHYRRQIGRASCRERVCMLV